MTHRGPSTRTRGWHRVIATTAPSTGGSTAAAALTTFEDNLADEHTERAGR